MKPANFFVNVTWLTAGNLAVKPVWFVFITYVCIRTIGVEQYGVMAAALALMSIVDGTRMLGTSTLSVREVARRKERSSLFFTNFLVTRGVLSLIGIAAGLVIATLLGNRSVLFTVALAGLYIVARSFTEFCRTFYRANEIFKREAYSTVLEKILVVISGSVALAIVPSAASVLLGMSLGMIATSAVNYRWVVSEFARFKKSLLDSDFVRKTIPLAIPLGLSNLFILLFLRTDSVMIEAFVGEVATAQYALAFRILEALVIVPSIFVTVLLPRLSILSNTDLSMFRRISWRTTLGMFFVSTCLSAVVWAGAPTIIHLIDDSAVMLPSVPLLQVLIWSFPLSATNFLLSTTLTAANKQKPMAIILGIAAVLNIGLNLWSIPVYGATGAAFATIATQIVVSISFQVLLGFRVPGRVDESLFPEADFEN